MARTPSKKKPRAALRKGSRDPRQFPVPPPPMRISRGIRRGTHSTAVPSTRTLSPIPEENANATAHPARGLLAARPRSQQKSVPMEEEDGDDVGYISPNSGDRLRRIMSYSGDEIEDDADLKLVLLKSSMATLLGKNASVREMSFTPDQLEKYYNDLNSHRQELRALAVHAGGERGLLQAQLSAALPTKLSRKMKKKTFVAAMLVDVFFVLDEIISLASTEIPGRHCGVTKVLSSFCTSLVRVRNYCQHELANEQSKKKALKSLPITGKPMPLSLLFHSATLT